MKEQRRFIKSVLKSAEECTTQMPWQRGSARRAMIARRAPRAEARKTA